MLALLLFVSQCTAWNSYQNNNDDQYCYDSTSCNFGQTCIGGVCLQSRGGGGTLQSCSFDSDCGGHLMCSGGTCVSQTWECSTNSQCSTDEACLGGACQALYPRMQPASGYWCNDDSQCTVFETCQNYQCTRCNVGACLNRGSLNACFQDAQCQLAEMCQAGLCRTKSCKSDAQCGYTEVCDPTLLICVDCTNQLTVNGWLTPTYEGPSTNGNLPPQLPNLYNSDNYEGYFGVSSASATGGLCSGTGSGYWCQADGQCPTGEICMSSKCQSNNPMTPFKCFADSQCGAHQRCNQGLCVSSNQGGAGAIGSCQQDTDCAYNQVCQNNACINGGFAPWVPHN